MFVLKVTFGDVTEVHLQLDSFTNAIVVLGSIMPLYRAADGVKHALNDFIKLYARPVNEASSNREKLLPFGGHNIIAKSRKKANSRHRLKMRVAFEDRKISHKVFERLASSLDKFDSALRDLHDYFDFDGEKARMELNDFVSVSTHFYLVLAFIKYLLPVVASRVGFSL